MHSITTYGNFNKFQEKNGVSFSSIYDLNREIEILPITRENPLSKSTCPIDYLKCIKYAKDISRTFSLDTISINGVQESTIMKFIDANTIFIMTYDDSKIALSEIRALMTKFIIQFRNEVNLSIAS